MKCIAPIFCCLLLWLPAAAQDIRVSASARLRAGAVWAADSRSDRLIVVRAR
ncbi:MAG TPA: hypothetical protein VIM38_03695 [Alphaproteobacteria bacterium]